MGFDGYACARARLAASSKGTARTVRRLMGDSLYAGDKTRNDVVELRGLLEIDGMARTRDHMDRRLRPHRRDLDIARGWRDHVGIAVEDLHRHGRRQARDVGL